MHLTKKAVIQKVDRLLEKLLNTSDVRVIIVGYKEYVHWFVLMFCNTLVSKLEANPDQLNFWDCINPFLINVWLKTSSLVSCCIFCDSSMGDSGSKSKTASPPTSGKLDADDTIQGAPQAIASATGKPKPS